MRGDRLSFLLVSWVCVIVSACKSGEVHRCEEAAAPAQAAAAPRDSSGEVLEDRTGGGKLQGPALTGASRPQRVVFLLDYSGSMYGGYDNHRTSCAPPPPPPGARARPAPPGPIRYYYDVPVYKSMLAQLMDAATPAGGPTQADILLFNTKLWRVTPDGPQEFTAAGGLAGDVPTGQGPEAFSERIGKIKKSPYEVDPTAPNTTASSEALSKVVDALPDEAVVWLLTDNYADQGSTQALEEEAKGNRSFYSLLSQDPRIQVVAFYPLHLSDPKSWMCGSSLVAYGMYVSKNERAPSEEVARLWGTDATGQGPVESGLLWNPELKTLYESFGGSSPEYPELSGTPMRLKPVDQNVVSVGFVPLTQNDGRVLRCVRASFDEPLRCEAQITLRNVLRHQKVDRARLDVSNLTLTPYPADKSETPLPWASSVCAGELKVSQWKIPETGKEGTTSPIDLGDIPPLQSRTVQLAFEVPPVTVGHDGFGQLWEVAMTDAFELRGTLQANISDVLTALRLETTNFKDVYGIDNIPTAFRSNTTDRMRIEGPARARLTNDGQRLALMMVACLIALVLAVMIFVVLMQRVFYTIRVDGSEHAKIRLRRMGRFNIDVRGRTIARAVRGFGGDARLAAGPGWRLKPDGPAAFTAVRADGRDPDDHRVELIRGWNAPRNSTAGRGNRGF